MSEIHVLKFGGTSLRDKTFINQAVDIVSRKLHTARPVVIVSALEGVTDRLIRLAEYTGSSPDEAAALLQTLRARHLGVLNDLIGSDHSQAVEENMHALFDELNTCLFDDPRRITRPEAWHDRILSFGERASARIFAAALAEKDIEATAVEAQHFIKTDNVFGEANVIPELTRKLARETLQNVAEVTVITGFIGSTEDREITTLGRSGSDYTASLVADALGAGHLEIWTDVNGILTADPDLVPGAEPISHMSYEDIAELAQHGAKVLHPKTLGPLRDRDITVRILNSYNLDHPGTEIKQDYRSNGDFRSVTVTGPFVCIQTAGHDAADLNSFFESRIQQQAAYGEYGVSRSSRYEPASFLLGESDFQQIEKSLDSWAGKQQIELTISRNLYKIKKFTNRLRHGNEVFADILKLLGANDIHPVRINREQKQRYVNLLMPEDEAVTAARLIDDYFADDRKVVDLFIAGTGAVGSTLLQQLRELDSQFHFRVIGSCNTKRYVIRQQGIAPGQTLELLDEGAETDWDSILEQLQNIRRRPAIFVDATGSSEVARLYPQLMEAGYHIATPSKLANTFEQSYYDRLQETATKHDVHFRYETTVGAGLPVISTITDLMESGDTVTEISGVLSGTMTYLFDELENGTPFSQAVLQARENGYAEPDPRDDLSGEDVARKFLTLARTTGLSVERSQLEVESLVPDSLAALDRESFFQKLQAYDAGWQRKMKRAQEEGLTLRYTGSLTQDGIKVQVQRVPINTPLGSLQGTDNLLRIYTRRYSRSPIVIQGPGAGREVTAAGVLSDIIKIARAVI